MVGSCQLFKEKYAGKLSFHECVATQVFEFRYAILNWPILDAKSKRNDTSGAITGRVALALSAGSRFTENTDLVPTIKSKKSWMGICPPRTHSISLRT